MNQILQVEKEKNKGAIEIGKIAIFFAIACIIFGIILVGQGVYAIIAKEEEQVQQPNINQEVPKITINQIEENLNIYIEHTKTILKLQYHWNDEQEQTIEINAQTTVSKDISMPIGENTLYLTVVDSTGKETKYEKQYILEQSKKPVVELLLTKENKIRIKVEDTIGLRYIRYTWNNGNYVTIEANIENLNLIDELVEIPLGQNTLRVEAVNTQNIITTKELEVKGVRIPTVTLRQEGHALVIRAEDQDAMKSVRYTLNGQSYKIDFGEVKVIEYRQQLQQGENRIELIAENKDGGIREVKGICNVE